jgi:uncharacterized membrane protein SpoIIM required for sporulation
MLFTFLVTSFLTFICLGLIPNPKDGGSSETAYFTILDGVTPQNIMFFTSFTLQNLRFSQQWFEDCYHLGCDIT